MAGPGTEGAGPVEYRVPASLRPRKPWNPYRASTHTAGIPHARTYVNKTRGLSTTSSSSSTPVGGLPGHTSRTLGQTTARASLATAASHSQHQRLTATQRATTRSSCPPRARRISRGWALKWSVALAAVVAGSTMVKAVVFTHASASANPLKGTVAVTPRCGSVVGETPCSWWRGINLYSGFADQLGSSRANAALQTISGRDANNYVVYVPELDTSSDGSVSVGSKAISDDHLVQASALSASQGSATVLKPHISDPTNFAGGPGFVSSYGAVLEHYGRVATQMKAKVFVITTELTKVYRDPAAMNALIDAASRTYTVPGGRIAVAINWDQLHEALTFPWLKRVALVGIDGYWPLGANAGIAEMYAQWKRPAYQTDGSVEAPGQAVSDLAGLGKDVVFTEIGYQHCTGAAASPSSQPDPSSSSSCGQAASDPREQQAATQAAYCYWTQWARQHGNPSWFRGLWWWDWDLSDSANVWDVQSGAEGVIRSWNTAGGGSCPNTSA